MYKYVHRNNYTFLSIRWTARTKYACCGHKSGSVKDSPVWTVAVQDIYHSWSDISYSKPEIIMVWKRNPKLKLQIKLNGMVLPTYLFLTAQQTCLKKKKKQA